MPNDRNKRWNLDLSLEAAGDVDDIWDYLVGEASESVADRQIRQFDAAFEKLKSWPYSGRKRDEFAAGVRSVPVNPYVIFYRPHAGVIEVVRIFHGRRDFASILGNNPASKHRSAI